MNCLVREPDAGKPPVRFDERAVETEQGAAREAPATERAGNRLAAPKQPRHRSTLRCAVKKGDDPQQVQFLPGNWVAPAGS